MRAPAAALLLVLAATAVALAETQKEKLARLAGEVFEYEDVDESGEGARQASEKPFFGGGGRARAKKPADGDVASRSADSALSRSYELEVNVPDAWLLKVFERAESTPHPLVIEEVDIARDREKDPRRFVGTFTMAATAYDAAGVATEAQAEKLVRAIEKFLKDRPRYAEKVAALLEKHAKAGGIESLSLSHGRLTAAALSGPLPPTATAKPGTPPAPKALYFQVAPTATAHPPREPRPTIRPAREVMGDWVQRHLWTSVQIADDAPRGQIERAIAKVVKVVSVQPVGDTSGPLVGRAYDARFTAWWDQIHEVGKALGAVTATAITEIDLGEVPPPSNEYRYAGKRSLYFAGTLRVHVLGFDPAALLEGEEHGVFERAKAWVAASEEDLGAPVVLAIRELPPQCVVEHVEIGTKRFEIKIAGVDEKEARALGQKLGAVQEITGRSEAVDPKFDRVADTFIITIGRE